MIERCLVIFSSQKAASLTPSESDSTAVHPNEDLHNPRPVKKAKMLNQSTDNGQRKSSRVTKPVIREGLVPTPGLEDLASINEREKSMKQINKERELAKSRGRHTRNGEDDLFDPDVFEAEDDSNDLEDMRSGATLEEIKSGMRVEMNDIGFLDNRGVKKADLGLSRKRAEAASNAIIRNAARLARGQDLPQPELREEPETQFSDAGTEEGGMTEGEESEEEEEEIKEAIPTTVLTESEIEADIQSQFRREKKELQKLRLLGKGKTKKDVSSGSS